MTKTQSRRFIFALFLFIPPGQMAIDIYTPSMPHMVDALHTSISLITWTMIVYLFSMGIFQFVAGIVSDYVGRRKTQLWSVVIFLIGSLICSCAHSITWFLIGRIIQGMGAGLQTMVTAMLSDAFEGKTLQKLAGYTSMIWSLMPILAPAIGGLLQQHIGWEANFIFISIYILIAFGFAYAWIPETFPHHKRSYHPLLQHLGALKNLLFNPVFMASIGLMILMWFIMILLNILTPFFFETTLGYSAEQYGLIALSYGVAYFIGTWINVWLLRWFTGKNLSIAGLWVTLISAVILGMTTGLHTDSLLVLLPPLWVGIAATGSVFPYAFAKAMEQFNPGQAGLGSALNGSLIIIGTALLSLIATGIHMYSQAPLAIAYVVIGALSLWLVRWT